MALTSNQHNRSVDQANRGLLRVYAYYRFALAGLLLLMYTSGIATQILGAAQPTFFFYIVAAYTTLNFLTLLLFGNRRYIPRVPAIFAVLLVDIVAITLMMESSGGIQSGLGFLLLICVAAGSLFVYGQLALLLAATASVFVILSSVVGLFGETSASSSVFQAGLLGILLFVAALVFQLLNRRLRHAQLEAQQKTQRAADLQELNEYIVRQMRTGIVVINTFDTMELINDAAIQLLGGHPVSGSLTPGRPLRMAPSLYRQLERWRNYPWLRTTPFKERYSSREIQANFTTLEQGEKNKTLIFLEDTRALAQHAQQIKQASLSRLTGSIAHEIRNPLGAISHAAQLLEENTAPSEQAEVVRIIKKQSDRVNTLIENVMKLSRQQAPKLQKIELNSWLKRFIHEYLDSQEHDIEIKTQDGPNCRVPFDPSHLHQILTNLLDNAVRHSHEHTGKYWAALRTHIDNVSGHPHLDIIDRGSGIADDNRENIFEPFFTTSHDGSGLGLYISRELCELNFATLNYVGESRQNSFFRIGFAHPKRLLPGQKS